MALNTRDTVAGDTRASHATSPIIASLQTSAGIDGAPATPIGGS